jgi:hypothetical protein
LKKETDMEELTRTPRIVVIAVLGDRIGGVRDYGESDWDQIR